MKVYQVYRADMGDETGSQPMRPDPEVWTDEQAAWDSINTLSGVYGRRLPLSCYPVERNLEHGIDTWQKYKAHYGYAGDYDVKELTVR